MKPIFFSEYFKKQLKRLKKKYPNVKADLLKRFENLNIENEISIGQSIYKIRIASRDMKKGKSGGFRAYMYLYIKKDLFVPLCIYAKSEREAITEDELRYHFNKNIEEVVLLV